MASKLINLGMLAPLMLAMDGAYAASPSADLKVSGQLVVPVCTVAAANEGIYDLGKIASTQIKPAADTQLTAISQAWTVSCDAETYLNFMHVDNRASSASTVEARNFGLGNINGEGKIGFYNVAVKDGTVDGHKTDLFYSQNGTILSNNVVQEVRVVDGWRTGWSVGTAQKSGKVFAANIVVTPTLASSTVMKGPVTDDSNIDGSLTLNFAFGL